MNSELNQKISQLLDDDLHLLEQQHILRKVSKQPELLNKMNRYQAISHALKNNDFVIANNDFLAKVNKGLEDDSHYNLPEQVIKTESTVFWRKTSLAMAASVAVVSIVISQQLELNPPASTSPINNSILGTEKQLVSMPADRSTLSKSEVDLQKQKANQLAVIQQERLKAYLQAHSNDMYTHGTLDPHPYARVAGFSQE